MAEVINGTCDCHWKGMENWIGAKTVVFCSGYNASTLFSSLLIVIFTAVSVYW
jgi:hypothetical protein